MKRSLTVMAFTVLAFVSAKVWADAPVYSANGFICGKTGSTVTCKGPIPGRENDTVTGTGHNIIYLTVNTRTAGAPARYTYFSDTGCLVGYTFNVSGNPVAAVASHRSGEKKTFKFGNDNYDPLLEFCSKPGEVKKTTAAATSETTKESASN